MSKIDRELEGFQLGEEFKPSPEWNVLSGFIRTLFVSGLPNEIIYYQDNLDQSIFIGTVKGIIYKIAIIKLGISFNQLSKLYTKKYGSPSINKKNKKIWDDNDSELRITKRMNQINIILTDKNIFK